MKKLVIIAVVMAVLLGLMPVAPVVADNGFDEYGYNLTARVFVGTAYSWAMAKGWTLEYAQAYFGPYLYDQIVMKWNAEWDRGNAEGWANPPYKAWETNEWNGMREDGSQAVWHYKIVWVGSELENSPYWRPGGYAIWGQFEVIMDQGIDPAYGEGHWSFALAKPNGFGGP